MAFRRKPKHKPAAAPVAASSQPMEVRTHRGFDLASWIVPTLGFVVFAYTMIFVAMYTMKVGGPNVSLYIPPDSAQERPNTSVDKVLQGINDAFDPNKK